MGEQPDDFLSKRTKRAILVLVLVCLGIIYLPRTVSYFFPSEEEPWTKEQIEALESLPDEAAKPSFSETKKSTAKTSKFKVPSRAFKAEDYQKSDWMALGLSEKQAAVVLKFSKYGFKSEADLDRIAVIPDALKKLIRDSIIYKSANGQMSESELVLKDEEKAMSQQIELNRATKEQLMSLKGIGGYYADLILDYREKLGGFHSAEQLLEIKRFDKERYEGIKNLIEVDASVIRPINVNLANVSKLKNHPYINYNAANSIVKMREARGAYTDIDQLLESVLIDKEMLEKLKPYVSL